MAQGHPGAANSFDQRPATPQFKQPSSTSTVSLSTASLSTSTMKSEAKHEQSFNPQPTARKSLFCTQVVLRIATIRTRWDLISTNVVSILIEEGIRHGCLDSITSTSTVRRGGLSTSTTKSEAMHERMLCSCKLRLRRASPTVGLHSRHRALLGLRRLHATEAKSKAMHASRFSFLRRCEVSLKH